MHSLFGNPDLRDAARVGRRIGKFKGRLR